MQSFWLAVKARVVVTNLRLDGIASNNALCSSRWHSGAAEEPTSIIMMLRHLALIHMLISNVAGAMLIKYCDDDHEDDNDGADEIDDDSFPEERSGLVGG